MSQIPAIEKGVPLPAQNRTQYPWKDMQVGDSLWFPDRGYHDVNRLRCSAQKRHSIKLTVRKLKGGIRVWRTA